MDVSCLLSTPLFLSLRAALSHENKHFPPLCNTIVTKLLFVWDTCTYRGNHTQTGATMGGTNGGGKGWATDPDTGLKVMPTNWKALLDWLLMGAERDPRTQYEWANLNDVHPDSIRRIKRDPRFVKEWDKRAAELNINPERVQSVVDALWARASDGDVKAASLYLQYIDKFTPKRTVVVDDEREVAGLSDGELADELSEQVSHLRLVKGD
jgi:hypothetical protein